MSNICLLTIDLSTVGGINKVTFDLAKDLHENGHNVIVCGIINGNKKPFYECEGIKIINLFNENLRLKSYLFPALKKLKKIISEFNIQVILSQGEAAAIITACERIIHPKCKYIFCDHGALTYPLSGITKFTTYITLFFCGHLNHYNIFETKRACDKFKKQYFCYKVSYIYNYCRDDIICVNNDKKNILTVGRLTSQKGYDFLIEVAKQINYDFEWQWHIIGDGELYDDINNKIKDNKLDKHIFLLGNRNDLQKIYKNYYLMICTSRHEGLPMALIEAKFANLPIISFDIENGPSEIIDNKINGELIMPFDTKTMANRISYLLNNESLQASYSNNSHINISKFKKETVLLRWESFFNYILHSKGVLNDENFKN